jgi:hypothetical protein
LQFQSGVSLYELSPNLDDYVNLLFESWAARLRFLFP